MWPFKKNPTKPEGHIVPNNKSQSNVIMGENYNKRLMTAAYGGDHSATIDAIQRGANVNFIDSRNPSHPVPLLAAIDQYDRHRSSSLMIIKTLLEKGADPNTSNGVNNALMLAATFGYLDIVQLLLEYGADHTVANWAGDTPLSNAEHSGHSKIVEVIRAAIMRKTQDLRKEEGAWGAKQVLSPVSPYDLMFMSREITLALQALPVLSVEALSTFRCPDPEYPDDPHSQLSCPDMVGFLIDHLRHDAEITKSKLSAVVKTTYVACEYNTWGNAVRVLSISLMRKRFDGTSGFLPHNICRISENEFEICYHLD